MMPLLLVDTNFWHSLTDIHLSKLIMTVLTFADVSKFSSVDTANWVKSLTISRTLLGSHNSMIELRLTESHTNCSK